MADPIRFLEALAISVLAAAAVLLLLGWLGRTPNGARLRIGGVLGVGAGIYAGCWWLGVSPNWPPREDQDRLLFVLLPAVLVVESVLALIGQPRWLPWLLRLLVAAAAAPILLYGSSYISDLSGPGSREWTPAQTSLIFGALALALAAVWSALWLLLKRAACRSVPIVVALDCAGAAVVVMLSGYASGGQIGLTIFGALLGVAIASLAFAGPPEIDGVRGGVVGGGAVGVGVVCLFALLVVGRFFGQLSTANAALLLCAPLLAWGAEIPFVRRRGPLAHGLASVALPAICVAAALLLAHQRFVAESSRTATGASEPSADDYTNFGR